MGDTCVTDFETCLSDYVKLLLHKDEYSTRTRVHPVRMPQLGLLCIQFTIITTVVHKHEVQ